MGLIYSNAKSVVIWLGPEGSAVPNAIRPDSFLKRTPDLPQLETMFNERLPEKLSAAIFVGRRHIDDEGSKYDVENFIDDDVLLAFTVLYMLSQDTHLLALAKPGTPEQDSFRERVLCTVTEQS